MACIVWKSLQDIVHVGSGLSYNFLLNIVFTVNLIGKKYLQMLEKKDVKHFWLLHLLIKGDHPKKKKMWNYMKNLIRTVRLVYRTLGSCLKLPWYGICLYCGRNSTVLEHCLNVLLKDLGFLSICVHFLLTFQLLIVFKHM